MSQDLLTRLWALTLIASGGVLLVLLIRPLLRRAAGAGLAYASWLLVPLVLLASALPQPVQLALPVSTTPVQWVIANAGTLRELPAERASLWAMLWLAGVVIATLAFTAQQLRFQRRLGRLQGLGDGVCHLANGSFSGPLLVGLLRPRIVLPTDFFTRYDAREQELILAHEAVHLRRHDSSANLLTTLFQTVFWFNPLLHFAARRVRLDQELACDAAVLAQHPNSRSAYAGAILKAALIESSAPLACHWQSRHPLKERILQLTRTPPAHARRIAARALLSALALGACYTAWATSGRVAPSVPQPVQVLVDTVTAVVLPVPATPATESASVPSAMTPKAQAAQPQRTRFEAPTTVVAAATVPPESSPAQAGAEARDTPPPAPEGLPSYKIDFKLTWFSRNEEGTTTTKTTSTALVVPASVRRNITFFLPNEPSSTCEMVLTLTPRPDEMVFLDMALNCGGQISSPRLLTQLGQKASLRIGDESKYVEIGVTVTQ
jgi:beta-lactamase regulating signal transducer with metallopeptidase domain